MRESELHPRVITGDQVCVSGVGGVTPNMQDAKCTCVYFKTESVGGGALVIGCGWGIY